MQSISDAIEAFIIQTLGDGNTLSISRNELAAFFAVAPSQVTYVLATRFTPDRGFILESRRGGGGSVTVALKGRADLAGGLGAQAPRLVGEGGPGREDLMLQFALGRT